MSFNYMNKTMVADAIPLSSKDFEKVFLELGIQRGDILIVHSSVGKFDYIIGGCQAIYTAIKNVIGNEGTIIVPSQTLDITDPASWNYPKVPKHWIEKIKQEMPSYDKKYSVASGMGIFSEYIRNLKDSVRSNHPIYSFSGVGMKAQEILESHPYDYGLGWNSPLGKLYDLNAKILLLGTDFETNTSLHLAEYNLNRKTKIEKSKVIENDVSKWIEIKNIDLDIYDDFLEIQEKYRENIERAKLNKAEIMLVNMRECVDFATKHYKEKE